MYKHVHVIVKHIENRKVIINYGKMYPVFKTKDYLGLFVLLLQASTDLTL